jgi:hypothetical protein
MLQALHLLHNGAFPSCAAKANLFRSLQLVPLI